MYRTTLTLNKTDLQHPLSLCQATWRAGWECVEWKIVGARVERAQNGRVCGGHVEGSLGVWSFSLFFFVLSMLQTGGAYAHHLDLGNGFSFLHKRPVSVPLISSVTHFYSLLLWGQGFLSLSLSLSKALLFSETEHGASSIAFLPLGYFDLCICR